MSKRNLNLKYEEIKWSLWPEAPSEDVYNDFVQNRRAKNAPVTQTVINIMAPHIRKLYEMQGISPDEALGYACLHGWQTVKYQWVINAELRDMDGFSDVPTQPHYGQLGMFN